MAPHDELDLIPNPWVEQKLARDDSQDANPHVWHGPREQEVCLPGETGE